MNNIPIGIHKLVEVSLDARKRGNKGPPIGMGNGKDHGISIGDHMILFLFFFAWFP